MSDISNIIKELKSLVTNGDEISDEAYKKLSLAIQLETHDEVKKVNGRLKKVEAAVDLMKKRPSLLTLLHTQPKRTVTVILGILFIWSIICHMIWDNGLISEFIKWLNLPPILP